MFTDSSNSFVCQAVVEYAELCIHLTSCTHTVDSLRESTVFSVRFSSGILILEKPSKKVFISGVKIPAEAHIDVGRQSTELIHMQEWSEKLTTYFVL